MAKRGRKNKYETHVKPHLKEIEEWCNTMTEQQIAKRLGVAYSSWNQYKLDFPELSESIKKGRTDLVTELRSALIKRAKGFSYTETKIVKEYGKPIKTEVVTKIQPPDVAALNLCLKNYDSDNWANDPQMLRIRERELELREKQIENNSW